jgi:RNA polymerase sigma factor (TIGR02999 family)
MVIMGPVGDSEDSREVSRLLRAVEAGEPADLSTLFPRVYDGLRRIAARQMAQERGDHTLQTTALVHEVYLRLLGQEALGWRSKAHFYGAAAEAMRRILIDHARKKRRAKRGGGQIQLPLDAADLARRGDAEEIVSVDEAIRRLEERDVRMAEIVKLRFYAGLSVGETARALGVTDRTVYREWELARTWLRRWLEDRQDG